MKLANPLYYPIAVLAGGIVLVVGVRLLRLPGVVMLPVAVAVATAGAAALRASAPPALGLADPVLEREFQSLHSRAQQLVSQAQELRSEAAKLLTHANQMDLLVVVQDACDRTAELPDKIRHFAQRLQGRESLLSVAELQAQLGEVQQQLATSAGVARDHLQKMVDSLQRNIQLARQGQDARQAQLVSLSTLLLDAGGALQRLQNQLRTADLADSSQVSELRSLSQDFHRFQEDMDLLVLP